jgi:hypothetical protein
MKMSSVGAQHTKTMAGDHCLNRDYDKIVIRFQGGSKAAGRGIQTRMPVCSAREWAKIAGCIA